MTGSGGRTCGSAHLLKLHSRALGAISGCRQVRGPDLPCSGGARENPGALTSHSVTVSFAAATRGLALEFKDNSKDVGLDVSRCRW